MINFFNTMSGKVESFKSIREGHVGLYTCGPTVYDYAHIGNFRSYLFEDLLKKFLIYMGYSVLHVMNITDIDDKTIKGANEQGVSLNQYTKKYIDAFFSDIDTLNILRADHYPRATEFVPEMARMVAQLIEKGYAYKIDGSVYFDISKFPAYGRLSKIDTHQLRKGQRVEADDCEKENVVDFALWKSKKADEPFWETEIGPGRPGWHIECSVMSSRYLGPTFDIHCGGVDNIFPHHENEIAQSVALSGHDFVNFWIHCHHLIVDGEKMSKSKGNFYVLKDLIEMDYDPRAIRLLLLSTHYRKQLNFTFPALEQAVSSFKRLKDFHYELQNLNLPDTVNPEVTRLAYKAISSFKSGLSDDLNVSVAFTSLFDLIKKGNILIQKNELGLQDAEILKNTLFELNSVIGVLPAFELGKLPAELQEKIDLREKARAGRDFAMADRMRDELAAAGIILEDTKDGVRWKRK